MSLIGERNYGNGKDTLTKGGRNPPEIPISEIVRKLLGFFSNINSLNSTKKKIKKKYRVKKDCSGCWPEDDIKRAWGKTQRMKQTSNTRKLWSYVILLQVTQLTWCKIKPQLSLNDSPEEEPGMTGNTRDRSTQSGAKLNKNEKKEKKPATTHRSTQSGAELKKNEEKEKKPATRLVYIKIPFSEMFGKKTSSGTRVDQNIISHYKLIDRVPSYDKTASEIRKRKSYIISYNNETKNADWVYEILNESILKQKCKEQMTFGKNELENKDCNQGHLAAAANHVWCQEAYHDTFLMSNMIPQNKRLNVGVWSKLEQHCRDLVKNSVRNVHVYTGPLYPDKKKKKNESVKPFKKAVPTHFFKVVIVEKKDGTVEPECYVMPNEESEESLNNFKVSIETFDRKYPFTFIECDKKYDVQVKKTEKLTGEDTNGELHSVEINVILTPSHT